MADSMDMDSDMDPDEVQQAVPLRLDLTCPVCMQMYRDPMALRCSHTLCRKCLESCARVKSTCPLCREPFKQEDAVRVLALANACETYQKTGWRPPPDLISAVFCNHHQKVLELYCENDEVPLCVECVPLHTTHRLLGIQNGASLCRCHLNLKVGMLEKKLDSYQKLSHNLSNTKEHIKRQAAQAERHITAEFERLRQALLGEENRRLEALVDEERQKTEAAQELKTRTKRDMLSLRKLIDSVRMEMGKEDIPLLQNFQSIKQSALWTKEDNRMPNDALLDMGKHIGSLSFNIWKSLQDHVQYYPVVLDPNTASPWLSLSEDLTSVKEASEQLCVPDVPERFKPCVFVLGSEGFTSGKHKWDVHIADHPKWIVGVCRESVPRKKKFTMSPNRGVWAIGLNEGVFYAFTQECQELNVQQRPGSIRVKLNMERGEVSFWDGGTATHLVTLNHTFNEKIFPIFSPGLQNMPMILDPGKISVHTDRGILIN